MLTVESAEFLPPQCVGLNFAVLLLVAIAVVDGVPQYEGVDNAADSTLAPSDVRWVLEEAVAGHGSPPSDAYHYSTAQHSA